MQPRQYVERWRRPAFEGRAAWVVGDGAARRAEIGASAHASRERTGRDTLDSTGDVGVSVAMTADAAGHLHVSYVDATNRDLKYASDASGSWQTYVIDGARSVSGILGSPPGYTSIGVSSTGRVHISYRGDSRLRVASTQ